MMKRNRSERGSAMLLTTILLLILVGVSGAYMTISWANKRRASLDLAATQALYIAEAGAAAYVSNLNTGATPAPLAKQYLGGGYYWVPVENLVDFSNPSVAGTANSTENAKGLAYVAFQVAAKYGGVTRRLDVIANHQAGGVFWNAIFAGNNGDPSRGGLKDPNYTLRLQGATVGSTTTSDTVNGNVYSGGNFSATGPVNMAGTGGVGTDTVTYAGTSSSSVAGPGYNQGTEPALNIPRTFGPNSNMSQAQYNAGLYNGSRDSNGVAWIDVGAQFNSSAATPNHQWVDGSTATDILNPNNPAHIFRKNPSSTSGAGINRTAYYEHTVDTTTIGPAGNKRADYYMEDPTNSQVTQQSLTGVPVNGDTTASMLNVQPSGNNAVYYVPGNLRVSGEPIKSYQLDPAPGTGSIKMTMVVQGNVSLTDNILYPNWESTTDSMAIIAITDPNYPNTVPSDFAAGSGSTPLTPNGVSITQFVNDFNTRATAGRAEGLNMPNLDLSTPADQYRASVEYNKIYGSGNVYFGDPGSGTVEHFEGFLYAENNFYATDLDTTTSSGGTKALSIWGNMTAGNQVNIDRNSTQSATGMIPFSVLFDPAIMGGNPPPGLPATPQTSGQPWVVASWRQSANTAETKDQ